MVWVQGHVTLLWLATEKEREKLSLHLRFWHTVIKKENAMQIGEADEGGRKCDMELSFLSVKDYKRPLK